MNKTVDIRFAASAAATIMVAVPVASGIHVRMTTASTAGSSVSAHSSPLTQNYQVITASGVVVKIEDFGGSQLNADSIASAAFYQSWGEDWGDDSDYA
jgi:hypothetical protein